MLAAPNPHGKPNSDVVRPWMNGLDVTRRPRRMWIVDYPPDTSESDAAKYERPFSHILKHVKPAREGSEFVTRYRRWWVHARPGPAMRTALDGLSRFIATPSLTKHRLFVWLGKDTLPDHQLVVFARDDDYFFGVLHSKPHELWARATGTQLREATSGFRYTPTTCFETFPLPWPPGSEPTNDPRVEAIAAAARELNELREGWLNPPQGTAQGDDEYQKFLKKRTLTNLYNERPTWLDHAHRQLDEAVFAAYGWPSGLSDPEILERLLKLNHERATKQDGSDK